MAIETGLTEIRKCESCDSSVVHREVKFISGHSGTHWSAERHTAPCGLPCLGGGIGTEVIRPMRAAGKKLHEVAHGSSSGACTACGARRPARDARGRAK